MPNARGFETCPLAQIQNLRHNLVDRYPRDAIVKELLQNAEDAQASSFSLGWTPGLLVAEHPLLRGPALFTVNDGPFSTRDDKAICQFGLNYKAADRTTIGKFGLGLKSVLHLCEAFFYLAWTSPGNGQAPEAFNTIVNPWLDTPHHRDWNEFAASDQQRVHQHLGPLLKGPNWFCLWLPLRRESHRGTAVPIHKDFPGDDPHCPATLITESASVFLAEQLPLLKHLRQIAVWNRWDGPQSKDAPFFKASVPEPASRSRFPDRLATVIDGAATVALTIGGRASEMPYALVQNWLTPMETFRSKPGWPQAFSLADDGEPRPEKAEPHCAISLSRRPVEGPGQLVISTAVFLPLRDATWDYPCKDKAVYTLKLHGCFFVDAGRGQPNIDSSAANGADHPPETKLKHEWNQRLFDEGIYPLLVPAVAKLVEHLQKPGRADTVTDDSIRGLTESIQESATFQQHRAPICSMWQWVYRWRPGRFAWEKIPTGLRTLEIPDPGEAGAELPALALPQLAEFAEQYVLTPAGWPRLSAGANSAWPADILTAALGADPKPLFEDARRWAYVRRFVESAFSTPAASEGTAALAGLLRRVFAEVRTRAIRDQADAVRAVVRRLPAERRLRLPLPATWSEGDRQALLAEPISVVLVPAEFDPEEAPATGRLPEDEACRLLTALQPLCQRTRTSGPPRTVLAAAENAVAVLARCAGLALWQGERVIPDGNAPEMFSHQRLTEARHCGALFSSSAESASAAALLTAALAGGEIFLLPPETAEALFGKGAVPACDPAGVLIALQAAPQLAPPERRVGLLRYLLAPVPDGLDPSLWRRAARYLLHGRPEAIGETVPLYGGQHTTGGIWAKLARAVLDNGGGGWRVIPPGPLSDLLSEQQRKSLEVYAIDAEGVAQLLAEADATKLDLDFGPQDQEQVILGLRDFPDLLKALPLHDGPDGRLYRIDGRSYWKESWYSLDGRLGAKVRLLRLSPKEHLAAIQRPLAPILNPVEVLKLAVTESAHDHWETVFDALTKAGTLPTDLRAKLASAEWLPLRAGGFAAPAHVLYDADLKDEVAAVLTASTGGLVSPTALRPEVRTHAGFDALVRHKLFPARDQLFARLGRALQPTERFRVGPLPFGSPETVAEWLDAFRDAPADVMPVRDLLTRVHDVAPDLCRSHFVPNLTGEIAADRLERILVFLRERHAAPTAVHLTRLLRAHNAYLRLAAADGAHFALLLPRLRLLNRAGEWEDPARLCAGVTGVDPAETLDAEQEEILKQRAKVQKPRELPVAASTTSKAGNHLVAEWHGAAKRLDEYFREWADCSEDASAWARAFLSLMGDFPPVCKLAEKYLPRGRSPEYVRAAAGLRDRTRVSAAEKTLTENPAWFMAQQRFLVEVTEPRPTVRVVNLFGAAFDARAAARTDDLLIGYGLRKLDVWLENDLQVHWVHLRRLNPARTDPADLRRQLLGTADRLLRTVYGQKDASLRDVLSELTDGEEFGVRAAQAVLLDGAGFYLRQFGLTAFPTLREVLRQYDDAADRRAEECGAAELGRKLDGETAEAKAERARRRLQELIETNAEARAAILAAVRRKLGDYRYQVDSVLFELFQNADDAYVEREAEGTCVFAVTATSAGLAVLHAGRQINKAGAGAEEGGHIRDLHKMLALGHSDKGLGSGSPAVTGRFGLGFKSVFLVCDQPRAVSGRLGFEILGAVYPRPLGKERAEELRGRLRTAGLPEQTGTAFELPLRIGVTADEVLSRFRNLAHYLVVFARKVRRCLLPHTSGATDVSWTDEAVAVAGETVRVTTGALRPAPEVDTDGPRQALVVRTPDGEILLGLDAGGFARLSACVPSVWVTAPTQERHDLGWAVNGPFTLDVGRSQVDWAAEANRGLAARLGADVGAGLIALFDAGEGVSAWAALAARLRLATGVSAQDFWESLWRTLAAGIGGPELLRSVAWGGAARLYAERAALPTGLDIAGRRLLTRLDQVEAVLCGVLDAEGQADLRSAAAGLEGLRRLPAGAVVSHRLIWSRLRALCPDSAPDRPRLDLPSLLAAEVEARPEMCPDRAARYGKVVTLKLLEALDGGPAEWRAEAQRLREDVLIRAQFRTRGGSWEPARRLLLPRATDADRTDEPRWAAFAEPCRILGDEYFDERGSGPAVEFVLACRGRMEANIADMMAWAAGSSDDGRRLAVLNYLLDGDLGSRLAEALRVRLDSTWLAGLEGSRLLAQFSVPERNDILSRLRLLRTPPQGSDGNPQPRELDPKSALRRIARWWAADGAGHLRRYEQATYPHGCPPQLSPEAPGDNPTARRAWLTLFLSGMMLTLGRGAGWRGHNRKFLEMCDNRGWLDLLADPAAGSSQWLRAVEGYIDGQHDQIPYFHWLRQFVGIVTVARHLDAYAACFLAPDQIPGRFSLRDLLAPRASPHFQGTGVDAPPLGPVLGIGAFFIMRELVRSGVVVNRRIHRYCYPPAQRLCEFLSDRLGWADAERRSAAPWTRSRSIYEFLRTHVSDPTFGGAFDLPLLTLAEDPALQETVLRAHRPVPG